MRVDELISVLEGFDPEDVVVIEMRERIDESPMVSYSIDTIATGRGGRRAPRRFVKLVSVGGL